MSTLSHSLEAQLTAQEIHNSPFEQAIRKLPLPVLEAFGPPENLSVPVFVSEGDLLEAEGADLTRDAFPLIAEASGNRVLFAATGGDAVSGKRVAVLFSGGPAAGGHNVVVGLYRILAPNNHLLGVKAGPKGLLNGDLFEIKSEEIASIQNTGGFDFLGSDRTKIKTEEQFQQVIETVKRFALDGIVIIGGDDSNTNAAFLAEVLKPHGCAVIGVPKTIDGDLQVGSLVPISFGFDTATKIYAELVGNILQDTPSSRKYWHFVKLMGRSASHVALEVALQTRPAVTLVSEEIAERQYGLDEVVTQIA
ncbi:diphosphate--fructose-6-phosphate 1-phosphotransferase, partial [bacterium]|nr:diphosphate--fructose-6-phosphate 1-phosphotransferase [bacterium]